MYLRRSIHLDLNLIPIRIADKRREAFAQGAIVYLGLSWLESFAFECRNHVVDARTCGLQAEMLFTQIRRGRRIRGRGLEQIQKGSAGPQRSYIVSGFGFPFAFDRES